MVGASAAGLTAAEVLRREGYSGELVIVGEEQFAPYDRPPLSKQFLKGAWDTERVSLRRPEALHELACTWRLGTRATGLDVQERRVQCSDGTSLEFDGLVIATGVRPRGLPGAHAMPGVHLLRTLRDATALRDALAAGPPVAVIGAGFLGAEAAATCRELGLAVTLIDPLEAPLIRQLGEFVARWIADLHHRHDVHLRFNASVDRLISGDHGITVTLSTGEAIRAGLAIVAIGSIPNTEWLVGSGLSVSDGVDCDDTGLAAPGIVAAGDCANWLVPGANTRRRVEHRTNATEQATIAARTLLGRRRSAAEVSIPYFWSDQFGAKIQVHGHITAGADFMLEAGNPASGQFAGVYLADGHVVAALAVNLPAQARQQRARIGAAYTSV